MHDVAAPHTTLIPIASLSASFDMFKVGVLFKSLHIDQCAGETGLTDIQAEEVVAFVLVEKSSSSIHW